MATINRQWILKARPKGLLAPGDLQLAESPVAELREGQTLARVKYLSIDPTMRVWMARDTYLPAVPLGQVKRGFWLGGVGGARSKEFKTGGKGGGLTGPQKYRGLES